MTLTELRYLVALAQEGNFSRAAERCFVSQPTLSVAIAKLEDELGVQLFERGKGFVSTSPLGKRVVEQAGVALKEAEKVRQLASAARDQLAGALRLGVIHTVGPYLLPQLIPTLKLLAPGMPLAIEENMTSNLAEMLRHNAIDAALVAQPFAVPDVLVRPLYDESFQVVVPRDHSWAQKKAIAPEEVVGEEVLLLKAGNCFRDQVLGACPQLSSAEGDIRLGHSIGTIRCMVASGLGVSVLPESALSYPYGSDLIVSIPFTPPVPSRRIAVAWRTGFVRPRAIDALIRAVRTLDAPALRLVD
jgi:LysR family hydrogen peroxide-inducible transcriptional activator